MLTVRIKPETERRLEALARATKRSKSHFVERAIQQYLEDREDIALAKAVLARREPRIGIKALRKKLGLDH
ncbi:ribbon-helix-helix domain-containing protein [Ferrovibrio sp.]|uniref:type II toxin-antitoxin system RelB family antitoxin n=1 Tax=Ferrovibrio sp. TaxID=1917215 RepID=UPI0025C6176C|nr:ribbon-helix-helix domain-containing protein [Ferrovibrio sp.]MBX3453525.1 ribbon-helix-helix protein, CopG family [Ferrovibrio sp.]